LKKEKPRFSGERRTKKCNTGRLYDGKNATRIAVNSQELTVKGPASKGAVEK